MKKVVFFALALIFLAGCGNTSRRSSSTEFQTTLKLNWIFSGSFAPEAFAKKEFAKVNNLDLTIEQGGMGIDPLRLVRDNEFGVAAADEILRANDRGADFVIIGVINYDSPACFIALESDNIRAPQDFVGRTVGILPFGSTGIIYQILLRRNNIDRSSITEVTVYPDLRVFIAGNTHQIHPAFIYDETVTLENEGIRFNVIEPRDFGVRFKGLCYFTTANTIRNNPELAQTFINTVAAGMNAAIKEPEKAMAALKELAPDISEERELQVWRRAIPYYQGYNNQPLTSDIESWIDMIEELRTFNEIRNTPDLNRVLNFRFIEQYYSKKR